MKTTLPVPAADPRSSAKKFVSRLLRAGVVLPWLIGGGPARAQLVNDGDTVTLNGVRTNIIGDLTVGTNGSFTTLTMANGAKVTNNVDQPNGVNSSDGRIGLNSPARGNRVVVTGPGSAWRSSRDMFVGIRAFP